MANEIFAWEIKKFTKNTRIKTNIRFITNIWRNIIMKQTKKCLSFLLVIAILVCGITTITAFAINDNQSGAESEIQPMLASECDSFPDYPGDDPSVSPGVGWEWRGPELLGAWFCPSTTASLHPHLNSIVHGPHWDYTTNQGGAQYRLYPDGRIERKK